jgi:CDP-glycerol glycerophosphotransferase (TagB/SpsB family)
MDEIINIIPPDRSRRTLFEEASLLVTDCMSAFDMAYMNKPVLYFNFAEGEGLPFGCRFDEEESFPGGVRFGGITDDEDLLADKIIAYMANSCVMCEEDRRRVGEIFTHTGGGNRERIYNILCETAR